MHFDDKVTLEILFCWKGNFSSKHFYQKYISIVTFKMIKLSKPSSFDCKGRNVPPSSGNPLCYLLKSFTDTAPSQASAASWKIVFLFLSLTFR